MDSQTNNVKNMKTHVSKLICGFLLMCTMTGATRKPLDVNPIDNVAATSRYFIIQPEKNNEFSKAEGEKLKYKIKIKEEIRAIDSMQHPGRYK